MLSIPVDPNRPAKEAASLAEKPASPQMSSIRDFNGSMLELRR